MVAQNFATIPQIKYKGPDSTNPMSFRFYNPEKVIAGKTMKDHLRFAIAAWHTVCNPLADPFGPGTVEYEWAGLPEAQLKEARMLALAQFAQKLNAPYVCFHGRDLFTPDADFNIMEKNYERQAKTLKKILGDHGIALGWGTEDLFSDPMYAQGSLNSPYPRVVARACAEIRNMANITSFLEGCSYVLWGGRVGYQSRVSNDVEKEIHILGNVYRAIVEYFRQHVAKLQLLEEPKAKEPKIFQYSRDVATTANFLRSIGVLDSFKFNIEGNHAELAGVELGHECTIARIIGNKIGGIDANSGVPMTGWDVDEYHRVFNDAFEAWEQIDLQGGLGKAVINHDAKPRREGPSIEEKVFGHIMAMDLWALALRQVEKKKVDGAIQRIIQETYSGFDQEDVGRQIRDGTATLDSMAEFALAHPVGQIPSSRYQEAMIHQQRFIAPR